MKKSMVGAPVAIKHPSMADVTEIRQFANPPELVKTVMAAVAVLLGENEDWNSIKLMMKNKDAFLAKIKGYDSLNVSTEVLKRLTFYTS